MSNIAVITGASRGIGKAAAAYFLKNGWQVVNLSRKPCPLKEVTNLAVDFADHSAMVNQKQTLDPLLKNADKICLIHSAGYLKKDTIQSMTADTFRESLEINLVAPVLLNQLVLPHMKRGSSIIYLGSTLSEKAVSNTASYVISKHGVAGLMRATCQDLLYSGIHTCCICPGFTDTEMLQEHTYHNDAMMKAIQELTSEKRLIQPEEIANFIGYCANHSVINGAVLHANLGMKER